MYIPIQDVSINFDQVRKFKIIEQQLIIYYSNGDSEKYYYQSKEQITKLKSHLGILFKLYQKN